MQYRPSFPSSVVLFLVSAAGIFAACVTPKLSVEGGACATVADCEPGLVCAPKGDERVCTTDLTGLGEVPTSDDAGGTPDATADAARDAGRDGGRDGGTTGGTTGATTGGTTGATTGATTGTPDASPDADDAG